MLYPISIVALRQTQLVLVSHCLQEGKLSQYVTNHPGQLSLLSFWSM